VERPWIPAGKDHLTHNIKDAIKDENSTFHLIKTMADERMQVGFMIRQTLNG
jgi:hypothetical protein